MSKARQHREQGHRIVIRGLQLGWVSSLKTSDIDLTDATDAEFDAAIDGLRAKRLAAMAVQS